MRITRLKSYLFYFLILVYVSGSFGCFVRPDFFLPFTPWALLLTLLCFLVYQPLNKPGFIFVFSLVAFCGFWLEVAGVKTGWIFGRYAYGQALGIKLFAVPLLISANWALLINCGIVTGSYLSKKPLVSAILSAFMVTLIDVLIEQVACRLDYWCFSEGKAGFHNYLGWFAFSFLSSYALRNFLYTKQLKIAVTILFLQLFYFSAINISVFYNFM